MDARDRRPRLARKVRLRFDAIENRYMLIWPERGMLLNDSAAEILKRCDGARTVDAIVEELAAASNEARARVRDDVELFFEEMLRRGLVEIA